MQAFTTFTTRILSLPVDDIDTDQIIPARFLKGTDKVGLGEKLFADWRKDPNFVLERPGAKGAGILLAGNNFGCGSSREHAPWALCDFGFRVVVAKSFADIFRNNALKNGLVPVAVNEADWQKVSQASEATVDLASETLRLPDGSVIQFKIDGFAKHCLLNGVDELGYLLSFEEKIAAYEAQHAPKG
jgi:3-isopropylmalate/(R)-2-methylmalate dehydratase small subunit